MLISEEQLSQILYSYKYCGVGLEATIKIIWESNNLGPCSTIAEKRRQEVAVELSNYKFNSLTKRAMIKYIKDWIRPQFEQPMF